MKCKMFIFPLLLSPIWYGPWDVTGNTLLDVPSCDYLDRLDDPDHITQASPSLGSMVVTHSLFSFIDFFRMPSYGY